MSAGLHHHPSVPGPAPAPHVLPDLEDAFRRARDAGEPSDAWISVAGHPVRLRFASSGMARGMVAPFGHLVLDSPPPGRAALEVRIWDDASAGIATPLPALPAANPNAGDGGGAVYLYRMGDAEVAFEPGAGMLSALAHDGRVGYLRAESADRLTLRERASPARTILSWWARSRGLQMVHAAAVGTAAGGVLLVGRAGSGKSTTALACLGSGLGYTADDCCLVSTGPEPWVHGPYATAKVARRRADWFPPLEAEIRSAPAVLDDEALLHLAAGHAGALRPAFPLRAVLVPEIGAAGTRLEPCPPAHALGALAPSTMFQFPGADAGTLGRLAAVVRRVPCHRLRLGPDVRGIPAVIQGLLAEASA